MATVTIINKVIPLNGSVVMPTLTALTSATDGAVITPDADHKTVILVKNAHASAAKTATIKKGNGLQGVKDLIESIPFGETHAFVVESGAFKNMDGTNKGKIIVVGESTDIQVGVLVLP